MFIKNTFPVGIQNIPEATINNMDSTDFMRSHNTSVEDDAFEETLQCNCQLLASRDIQYIERPVDWIFQ